MQIYGMMVLTLFLFLYYLTTVELIIVHYTPPDQCDFNATILPRQNYSFTNDNWPDTYDMGMNCRWTFNCIEGYACRLRCPDVGLPATLGCYMDKLLVTTTGDTVMGARVFCGRTVINVRSFGSKITMNLISSPSSPGGRFRCVVTTETWKQPFIYATMLPLSIKLERLRNIMKNRTKHRIYY